MDRKTMIADYVKNEIIHNPNTILNDNDDLLSAGILDSLGILQLVAYIEKTLGITVPDMDVLYENFKSIESIAAYLLQF